MGKWKAANGEIDILVHAVAYAPREDLEGSFTETTRAGFAVAMDVSAYSLVAMCREANAAGLLHPGTSVLTLSYYGAEKVVANYNVMGVAKAALEACVRYLAADLGPSGVRVNAISAGPVRTLSASGVRDFRKLYGTFAGPRAAAFEHHHRGRRQDGAVARLGPLERRHRRGRLRRRRLQRHGRAAPGGVAPRVPIARGQYPRS